MITQALILKLIDFAKNDRNDGIVKSLWNTYHCLNTVYTHEGRLYGKYCKNRFCTNCLGIRKAEMIGKYLPIIKGWSEPHFLTLTMKAVSKKWLKIVFKNCVTTLRKIVEKYEKRALRNGSIR